MFAQRISIAVTTDASGNATAFSNEVLTGRIINVIYVPDGTIPYANTVDLVMTGEVSGVGILTQSNLSGAFTSAPRQPTHGNADGSASLYAAAGTAVNDHVYIANERIKITLAQGGNAKTGTFIVILG